MRSLKKALKLLCWALLIILASFGIGLSGGVAIPANRRRADDPMTIEMVDLDHQQSTVKAEEEEEQKS
ncbi:hypothetical protein [Pedobacter polysacchareus]|nr:hypothetical protein [Pedobacter polysacchareus]